MCPCDPEMDFVCEFCRVLGKPIPVPRLEDLEMADSWPDEDEHRS